MSKPFWVVGVSGGPDSMALLDMLRVWGYGLVVVHVNYHKRQSANRDQAIVETYCHKFNIPIHVFDAPEESAGNFQDFARRLRMDAYHQIAREYCATGVFLAHHQDDQIETIVFQLLTNRTPQHLGIREVQWMENFYVIRPLLSVNKRFLIEYCHKQHIEYGIDESNLTTNYTRNQIRQVLSTLSAKKKHLLLKYQEVYNKQTNKVNRVAKQMSRQEHIDLEVYRDLPTILRLTVLREYLKEKEINVYGMSHRALESIDRRLLAGKHQMIKLSAQSVLAIQYNRASIIRENTYDFSVKFDKIAYTAKKAFSTRPQGPSTSAVTLSQSDFPITIRNARDGDKIKMRYGTKKVSRFFIDRKIPFEERRTWPVVENSQGEVILVVGLGCDVNHHSTKPNLYVLK